MPYTCTQQHRVRLIDYQSLKDACGKQHLGFSTNLSHLLPVTLGGQRSALSNAGGRFAPNFAALPNDVILVLYCIDGFCGAGRVIVVFGECSVFLKDDSETGMQWFSGHTSAVCPSTPAAPQSFLLPPHNHRTFRPTPGLGRVSRLVPSAVPMVAGGSA